MTESVLVQERIKHLIDDLGTWFQDAGRLASGRMTSELWPFERLFSPARVLEATRAACRIAMAL